METKVERKAPCQVAFNATVGRDDVEAERERLVASYLRRAQVPGFRKGKAPRPMVEKRYAEEIREDLQERLLQKVWHEVNEGNDMRPATDRIQIEGTWQDNGAYEVRGEVEVYPEVTIADTESFTPPEYDLDPTVEEIDQAIARLRERQGAWEPVEEGTVATDELLVESEVHGSFPDGSGEPFHEERSLFRLGAGEVFPEIEAAVRDARVGDEVTAERELGAEAGERAGTRISYRIAIKGLRRRQLPEADDEFARSLGVEEGLDAFKEKVADQIRHEKAHLRRDVWRSALVRHLAGDVLLELPPSVLEEETRKELIGFAQSLAARGVDPEAAEIDWKELQQDARAKVEERLRSELLLDAAAERLKVSVTDADVDAELQRQAQRMSVPFAELRGNLAKGGGLGRIKAMLRRERGVDQILGGLGDALTAGAQKAEGKE